MASFVVVLVIFMLLRKRELRNRLILLFGYGQIPTTTRALDEAGERISRYLLMQTIVNGTFGLAVGVSLYLLSLPYALLWGLLATLLRFIPYVGAWLGAALPFLLSLAVFPGWLHALLVLGVIAIFELINNMVMEPLLYGQSAGVFGSSAAGGGGVLDLGVGTDRARAGDATNRLPRGAREICSRSFVPLAVARR
jgi:predicted PurR-regulated permease PerM